MEKLTAIFLVVAVLFAFGVAVVVPVQPAFAGDAAGSDPIGDPIGVDPIGAPIGVDPLAGT